ncbi:sensor histidine kinase [Bacillus alkalicellulosilyticus]|uniref:sensor histidine kinase n=1 Tax=Alkalihalobacterium alkalicellulosilyticum TaxID=1912214 RepID=UPI000997A358|nr:HAMP domain-containing sensor histidine kinase [Bacillus alkalicellulosilyticus]
MNSLEPFLLNVLFLIVFLLFIPLLLELHAFRFFTNYKKWLSTISAAIAIILCILFPIQMMDGYFFDLRLVALTIGGLYTGIPFILLLALSTIFFRLLLGGIGAWATLIIVTLLSTCMIFLTNRFQLATTKRKILIGTCLSVGASIVALVNSMLFFGATLHPLFAASFVMITLVSTILIIYFYEVFHNSLIINRRVIKAEKMEIVSHLASSISHEVRNPLTVVRGFLQMMEQGGITEEQRKNFLQISLAEIDRANDIIRNYLTFAKPSPEDNEVLNVKIELENTIQIITPLAIMNGVEVTSNLNEYHIIGEKQIFHQCLINILKNCIEAMPHTGKLTIETSEDEGKLLIFISDNGSGMTKEQLSRLGEPYFTTKGRDGTGLGMMAAMKIIETLHGKIHVKSEVDEGTKFYIHFPLVQIGQ